MERDVDELIWSVSDAVGLDAYHMYPDTRRAIPDTVLWGFAAACILEFAKGFYDFKKLGESVRDKLELLLDHWRNKQDFEIFIKSEGIEEAVRLAVLEITFSIGHQQKLAAIEDLKNALVRLGIPSGTAMEHSLRLAAILVQSESDV